MLLNKKRCRDHCLLISKNHRNGRFTRVSKRFYEWLDWNVRILIDKKIRELPSKGKTI